MRARRAAVATALLLAATVPVASGCGLSLNQLPSTGGVSGPTYRVTAQFRDVADLTVGAKVKLQGVVIGQVSSISTKDFTASVAIDVARRYRLPATSSFQIRFTTPLGEDYIAVTTPKSGTAPALTDGARVGVQQTAEAPTIEDTFAALSLLLNGGGLDKLQTIARELSVALKGNVGSARDLIGRVDQVVSDLDAHKSDIDHLLQGMSSLLTTVNARRGLIQQALQEFPATISLLASDTGQLRTLLTKVGQLGRTVQGLLDRGQQAMLADFDALRPTLDALAASRQALIPTFDSLIKFGNLFDRATPGDYLNLEITVQVLFNSPPQRPQQASYTPAASVSSSDAISRLLSGGLR